MTDINQDLKDAIYTKEIVALLYQETRDIPTITKKANEILSKKELFISEETAKRFVAQIVEDSLEDEKETDVLVNQMLKAVGQDLHENEEKALEKKKSLNTKNSLVNTLKFCEVLVNKEQEGVVSV